MNYLYSKPPGKDVINFCQTELLLHFLYPGDDLLSFHCGSVPEIQGGGYDFLIVSH